MQKPCLHVLSNEFLHMVLNEEYVFACVLVNILTLITDHMKLPSHFHTNFWSSLPPKTVQPKYYGLKELKCPVLRGLWEKYSPVQCMPQGTMK